ncbi:MAG: hypothetical protein ACOY0T_11695 [Myxococcota bacterium]
MFGLNAGELGLVIFIVAAILSARYWPKLGERIALALSREGEKRD